MLIGKSPSKFACDACEKPIESEGAYVPVANRVELIVHIPDRHDLSNSFSLHIEELCSQCRVNLEKCLAIFNASIGIPLNGNVRGTKNGKPFSVDL